VDNFLERIFNWCSIIETRKDIKIKKQNKKIQKASPVRSFANSKKQLNSASREALLLARREYSVFFVCFKNIFLINKPGLAKNILQAKEVKF
jgi:hypothetical protein